ncbi:MAG: DEAD/DEAH box helicase [Candidatus Marinimicrobia bacterium]|nr:DEAD/DEAH box helicase [Candidatus Neomarinimicrobiota bacterium]
MEEVKRDMERDRIMDRLICGDVGFGKTEVAIRAAFKAVYSNKQVAVLVPTTMLCFQHFESFRERLDMFGIRVEYLNRFVQGKALTRRLADLSNHRIDVVVGTQKLLSNILLFNDLGLLIVDEEHRFGVNDKEKIRNLKRRVDVITLTATPIPRTLQMTLGGLRILPKIDTPPKERLPIATKIIYWDNEEVRAAVERELERNGQVFILDNNIREMPGMQKKISAMFPAHKVRYAHGKLPGAELEKTLLDFYHHAFDILISSTIIESGIDIPNANTLIVLNAHRFGLSQLYQIRRVIGRSHGKAFAYLVIPRSKVLNPAAVKRLQTLEYYTDLGSGYQIAMRDLEIRGAGDLFGVEQSGHINRLGYAYFNRLLTEEVESVKSPTRPRHESPDIQLDHPAYLPGTYIRNKDIRIAFYRELSDILSGAENTDHALKKVDKIHVSCRDRFGPLPRAAENLLNDARFSLRLTPYYIGKVYRNNKKLMLAFSREAPLQTIQKAAGSLLRECGEKDIPIRFISKTALRAEVGKEFLQAFYPGTFQAFQDSKPRN